MKQIAPSLLSADFSKLSEEILLVEMAGAHFLHLDIMDGHFVPNITMGPLIVEAVRKLTKLPLDSHLMIENPENYIEAFIQAGSNMVSVHQETTQDLKGTLQKIRSLGAKPGVVINPPTATETIEPLLEIVDYVLVMTVNPGSGGQSLIDSALEKVKQLAKLRNVKGLKFSIEVDGGINLSTIKKVAKCGCDWFVAGSGIFKKPPYEKTICAMKDIIAAV